MADLVHHNEEFPPPPDAHGQAALLLTESLLHLLRARGVLSLDDALEVITVAAETKLEVADAWGDTPQARNKSLALLSNMLLSFGADSRS